MNASTRMPAPREAASAAVAETARESAVHDEEAVQAVQAMQNIDGRNAEPAITDMLRAWRAGERGAADALMPQVYAHLHRLAHGALRGERIDHTLRPTALLHETFLRLSDGRAPEWRDRGHFFALAARTMRRVLVDHARAAAAERRGGDRHRVDGEEALARVAGTDTDLATMLALDAALDALSRHDARKARVVEFRCLLGLSVAETAHLLAVSEPTVVLDLRLARAWLSTRLDG